MRRKRTKQDVIHENTERWLLTYADLITLLLAFFIVMYSMSKVDAGKFGQMSEALNGILRGGPALVPAVSGGAQGEGILRFGALRALKQELEQRIAQDSLADLIEAIQDERGLVIRVMESAAFDPGSDELKPQICPVLRQLAREMLVIPNHVRVEGHTDHTPISTLRFPSNWELSTGRATRVVRYMVEELNVDPTRISALGYSEYRPIASNRTAGGRARNRRVDIIVLDDERSEPPPSPDTLNFRIALGDSMPGS